MDGNILAYELEEWFKHSIELYAGFGNHEITNAYFFRKGINS